MNHFTSALMSSLRALVIDPEDQAGKRIMAQVSTTKRRKKLFHVFFFFF
jgi:hypothetical protein